MYALWSSRPRRAKERSYKLQHVIHQRYRSANMSLLWWRTTCPKRQWRAIRTPCIQTDWQVKHSACCSLNNQEALYIQLTSWSGTTIKLKTRTPAVANVSCVLWCSRLWHHQVIVNNFIGEVAIWQSIIRFPVGLPL